MLRNEWLAHLDGLVVFRGLLAAESAPLSGLFSPAHSGSLQSTDGSSISKQPIP